MGRFTGEGGGSTPERYVLRDACEVKKLGVVLFSGFALPEAAAILEIFQSANALAEAEFFSQGRLRYEITFLSATGGRIDSSSSVFVWTERAQTRQDSDGFHALFVSGGAGARHAVGDECLLDWLRHECPRSKLVVPIGDGRLLLEAAGVERTGSSPIFGIHEPKSRYPGADLELPSGSPLRSVLAIVREDFGADFAHQAVERIVLRQQQASFTAMVHENAPGHVSEKILASARWLEANGNQPITVDDAAQAASMSERNFLRRFKLEMGVTPSDYLLYVRLDMCCRLLVETDLPVDKIARRCGLGGGNWLAKLFRKHLAATPTEYRASKRDARAVA